MYWKSSILMFCLVLTIYMRITHIHSFGESLLCLCFTCDIGLLFKHIDGVYKPYRM